MSFWWEQANWPAIKGAERGFSFFEDIRKLLFLIEQPAAGTIDIYRYYGKKQYDSAGTAYIPYDEYNWIGLWSGYEEPTPANPGDVKIVYKDVSGEEDIYVNFVEMNDVDLDAHPPIDDSSGGEGQLDIAYWKLAVNPNLYSHYNYNAGKPSIGADGRYIVVHHLASITCGHSAYTSILKAYKWLPRQTHPYRQVAPLDYDSAGVEQRRDPLLFGVETKDKYITQSIGTDWDRSKDTVGSEPCVKPPRISEYALQFGEPIDESSDCEISGKCAQDPKMNEAYQDRCIHTMEHSGPSFLKAIDENFIKEWLYDNAQEWECTGGGHYWSEGEIVYIGAKTIDSTFYVCLDSHTAITGDCKEPDTSGGSGYWMTPAYQPTLFVDHPVYALLTADAWRCNSSSYELVLREIDSYDWWWDTSHPFVSWDLYSNHIDDPENWPLPRGCWRRTWKHSMGRVGTTMWPQEKGEPPGYEPRHFIVTQAVYDTISEANQVYYTVSDVEGLYDAAYGGEEEALIVERHDPKVTIEDEPCYEIHYNLVNDLWNTLLELVLLDWPTTNRYWVFRGVGSGLGGGGVSEATSLAAYSAARDLAIADQDWEMGADWGLEFNWAFGYLAGVQGIEDTPPYYQMSGDSSITDLFAVYTRIPVADMLPGKISGKILLRVKYTKEYLTGFQGIGGKQAGCEFGFGDKTLSSTPTDDDYVYEWAYVKLEPGIMESTTDENYYYFWHYGYVLSDWPFTGEGEWVDFEWSEEGLNERYPHSLISIISPATGYDYMTLFEIDWEEVPESVFEEDDSNAIEMV